ncbi:AGCS family alanine or glycine:cation symporter [Williamsia limnetica]|uniref:AGCS family alanine or glycine:cation symporter n=1 Tax=Williamsia limnetica TaxID=882452 RepID=A0A318RTZ9_WILLI|nr:alanine/glycine:cation symporter family protein [Williamsia limnetica]PYE19869.1 AGCS family alanine or glycine:cation symporter [Williamsia limnetica]
MNAVIDFLADKLYSVFLIYLLLGAGIYFTVRSKFVQVRLFPAMLKSIAASRSDAEGGISSFQAFCVGLASRVGTGNIAGVAVALTLGGPGAIFWMWVVALVGMSTAFIEATLAQMFKVRADDGSFRGGPAYYIQRGLGSRTWGAVFAVLLIFAFGFAFNMVQANTIATTVSDTTDIDAGWIAVVLVVISAPILFGGIRRIARIAEYLLPIMAGVYVLLAVVIVLMNVGELPSVFGDIISSAFGLNEAIGGTAGGILAAMLNGVKRGLFSNEAGMGSAPNTAATATVSHPAKQGLIQSLGVFVDTIVICSATAFIVLVSGVYDPTAAEQSVEGATLTQESVADQLGSWTTLPMTILIFVFAFSSILGNYSYAEINLHFLGIKGNSLQALRTLVLAAIGFGSLTALSTVWALADVAMAGMATVNLIAILLLGKWAFGALKDFEAMRKLGRDDRFVGRGNKYLPGDLPGHVWDAVEDKEEVVPHGRS